MMGRRSAEAFTVHHRDLCHAPGLRLACGCGATFKLFFEPLKFEVTRRRPLPLSAPCAGWVQGHYAQ